MANPAALRAEVNAALSVPKSEWRARMESVLSFDGAHNAAEQLLELARAPARTDALRAAATH
jgi:hypothetical protein